MILQKLQKIAENSVGVRMVFQYFDLELGIACHFIILKRGFKKFCCFITFQIILANYWDVNLSLAFG